MQLKRTNFADFRACCYTKKRITGIPQKNLIYNRIANFSLKPINCLLFYLLLDILQNLVNNKIEFFSKDNKSKILKKILQKLTMMKHTNTSVMPLRILRNEKTYPALIFFYINHLKSMILLLL
ncbi:hypothetical protein BpHYR1_001554 [Brachionus plicatilis]|uniref:Uncharacterized protein n=1 Tax=Brachionus plicatilis TaxID=10195 RepID=A0A3M7QAI5_BRAPC|nr:hypothetical protein BpHYR1_001554 [Brachionus plicatilis]